MAVPAASRAVEAYRDRYREDPFWLVAAPGRVNLIGEHTDYNDGFVLPMAIDRRTAIAAGPSSDRAAVFHSAWAEEGVTIDLTTRPRRGTPQWANYLRGVIDGFAAERTPIPGLRAVIESDVPAGSGLSSSAALEVAVATLLEAASGRPLAPVAKALLCQRAEREFAGVPSGIMDQFTSTMATENHALLIDCRSLAVDHIPMNDPSLVVLIVNTNVRHDLASGEYARRHAECRAAAAAIGVPALRDASLEDVNRAALDPLLLRRARHVVGENARTLAAVRAMTAGDWPEFGRLMYASHASLRHDYEVSCRALDLVVDTAREIGEPGGVFGARMTGGGFGGSAICLVRADALERVRQVIADTYATLGARSATLFSSRPVGHASVLSNR